MKNSTFVLWTACLGLAVLLCASAIAKAGDSPGAAPGGSMLVPPPVQVAPPAPVNTAPGGNGAAANAYNMAPAMGQAAYFQEQFERTSMQLVMLVERLQKEYLATDEYRAASKKVEETRAAYEAARAPVLQVVTAQPQYRDLIEKHTRIEIALQQPKLPPEDVVDLAKRKMEYGAAASRMEAEALNGDANVRQTRADYMAAQADLSAKVAKAHAAIFEKPEYAEAKKALDFARDNCAATQGYLAGAWVTRNDTLEGDRRRYPGNSFVAPYFDSGNYWPGYYGFGTIRPF